MKGLIHASKLSSNGNENKIFAIQVKANQAGNRIWPLNKKSELIKSDNTFYVFVSFQGISKRPDYFIVLGKTVADMIKSRHELWLKTPGRNGQPHIDNDMRNFEDQEGLFLERWDLFDGIKSI